MYTDWTIDANENDLASYLCEVCDRRLKTKKGLNQHLMAIHSIKRRSNLDSMNEDEFERSHQIGVVPKKKPIRKVEKGRIGIKRSSKAKESEDDEEYKP